MAPRSTFVPAGADGRVYPPSCPFSPAGSPTRAAGVPTVADSVATAANTPFTRLPTMTPIDGPSVAGLCRGPTYDRFWLRPVPTFDHVGPVYPAGTQITAVQRVLGSDGKPMRKGNLALYLVLAYTTHNGVESYAQGFAALSWRDLMVCLGPLGRMAAVMLPYGKSMNDKGA